MRGQTRLAEHEREVGVQTQRRDTGQQRDGDRDEIVGTRDSPKALPQTGRGHLRQIPVSTHDAYHGQGSRDDDEGDCRSPAPPLGQHEPDWHTEHGASS